MTPDAPSDPADIYATPRVVDSMAETSFYHTMEVPGHGLVEGQWDLRQSTRDFLGHVDLRGKRVLELGPASGFLTFFMESQGAEVIACDLSDDHSWDLVPSSRAASAQMANDFKAGLRKVHKSFWFCHRAHASKAKVIYSSVYEIPERLGPVDIAIVSCVLLHLRDPLQALARIARLTNERLVVTEPIFRRALPLVVFTEALGKIGLRMPLMMLVPRYKTPQLDTWWYSTPTAIRQFMEVLGFQEQETRFHSKARFKGRRIPFFTVVGHRTDKVAR